MLYIEIWQSVNLLMKIKPSTCGFTKSANIKITIDSHVNLSIVIIVRGAKGTSPRPTSRILRDSERLVTMANTLTYAVALDIIMAFAKEHDFDNEEVMNKLTTLRNQKATKAGAGKKSDARKKNEVLAQSVIDTMLAKDASEIRAGWVKDNVDGINTPAKATAVLNVAVDMGLLTRNVIAKSATRNEYVYTIPTE